MHFFGEIALATNRPRTANVTALTDIEVVAFSRLLIKDILERYPKIKDLLEDVIKDRVTERYKLKQKIFESFT